MELRADAAAIMAFIDYLRSTDHELEDLAFIGPDGIGFGDDGGRLDTGVLERAAQALTVVAGLEPIIRYRQRP